MTMQETRAPARADGDDDGDDGAGPPAPAPASPWRRTAALVAGLTAVVAVPLVVGLVAVRSPTWFPSVDLAFIEMRVRDVGTRHTPVLGPGGRIVGFGRQGRHPGPLGYYALAPAYRLLGSTSWALQAASATVALAASATAIWLGNRRAGLAGALATTAGLLLLMRLYEPERVLTPWNPHEAMVWWVVLLLATWSVLCRDLVALPVVAVAAVFCVQCHIAYIPLAGGLVGLLAVALTVDAVRRPERRRPLARAVGVAVAVAVVLCLPVIVEQLTHHPGNLALILESSRHPQEPLVGVAGGWDRAQRYLDVRALLTGPGGTPGTWPALVLLAAWVASVAVAARLRRGDLLRLHAVAAAALALSFLAIVRIAGGAYDYLTLWARGTAAFVAAAVVVTAVVGLRALTAGRRSAGPPATRRRRGPAIPALGAVVAVAAGLLTLDCARIPTPDATLGERISPLLTPTAEAVDADVAARGDGPTIVTASDPAGLGSAGWTLMLALERRGYDARAHPAWASATGEHRTVAPADAAREVHVSVGDVDIARWRAVPHVEQVGVVDPRTPAERAEVDTMVARSIERLEEAGFPDLARRFREVRTGIVGDPRIPWDVNFSLARLRAIPEPTAVFLSTDPEDRPE
jgi:hypothetical protein